MKGHDESVYIWGCLSYIQVHKNHEKTEKAEEAEREDISEKENRGRK